MQGLLTRGRIHTDDSPQCPVRVNSYRSEAEHQIDIQLENSLSFISALPTAWSCQRRPGQFASSSRPSVVLCLSHYWLPVKPDQLLAGYTAAYVQVLGERYAAA